MSPGGRACGGGSTGNLNSAAFWAVVNVGSGPVLGGQVTNLSLRGTFQNPRRPSQEAVRPEDGGLLSSQGHGPTVIRCGLSSSALWH